MIIGEAVHNGERNFFLRQGSTIDSTRFERFFHYSNDIVLITDPDGKVLDANQRARNYFNQPLRGTRFHELFDGLATQEECLKNPQVVHSFRVRSHGKRGESHTFKLTLVPVVRKEHVKELLVILSDLKEMYSYECRIDKLRARIQELERERRLIGDGRLESALEELEKANLSLDRINKELVKELEFAALVQKSLLPTSFPEQKNLRFIFHFEPMGPVGGDYYDVVALGNERIGLIVADVSGHGVGSAFIAAMLKISFVNQAPLCDSPADLLLRLNKEYCRLIQTGEYVTSFYVIIDPGSNKLTFSGAGHPMPFLFHRGSNSTEMLKSEGFFLGMFEGAEYVDGVRDFMPGDRFLLYTDGIIEAFSSEENAQFGVERLLKSFNMHRSRSAEDLTGEIINEVKGFMQQSSFHDDFAMVVVDYKNE